MSFADEWSQLKEDALRRRDAGMELASASGGPAPTPTLQGTDLGLADAPLRSRASGLHVAQGEARGKSKLDDAEAVGKTHSGWDAGAASNDCVAAWQKRLHQLSDLVEDAAKALTKGMDAQISEDGSIAAKLRKSADWLEDA
ncbi:hypothetical protein [Streptomyces xantholiticus]|uniref:hypothetical protein n=1 Tax=Streptomyces xantholiticus TaxID=68285 RepID=UPI001678E535|nr:hypothetical protein [Streptomyces xantholiticus]GGW41692.1 hypothetical protein GCM10010381_28210 [Streptomyces xantholiticus]